MPQTLLVSISGAFCAGKTTLARALHLATPDSALIVDGARAAQMAAADFDWAQPDSRAFLYWYQIVREGQAVASTIYCDTSLIDVLAHHRVYGVEKPSGSNACVHARYDLSLLCDHSEISLVDDGLRDTDAGRQAMVHRFVVDEAQHLSRRIHRLSGNIAARTAQALDLVQQARDDLLGLR